MQPSNRRGLSSFEGAVLPSNDSFYAWDGTHSDIARQLYFRAKAGDAVSPYGNFKVPSAVQGRLEELRLAWDKLPGIAQRALLWDSGFGVSPTNEPVKLWTLNGHNMANLAVPLAQYQAVNCTERTCTQPDDTPSYSNQQCTGVDILKAARCVVEDFADDSNVNAAMWVTGGRPEVIPDLRIRKHMWKDGGDNNSYIVFSVHTLNRDFEPAWNACASDTQNAGFGSLVLPCHTTANLTEALVDDKQEVEGSDWVSRWLVEDYGGTASSSSGKFNMLFLIPIVVVVVVVGLALVVKKRRRKNAEHYLVEENAASPNAAYQRDYIPM
ncbi:hypothetical protein GN958_ATG09308 [Phytophthora infestans]|uniref:Uncharacterized protein n=1 Tax=Phytophthora infestans TaxID=4787 RepID=A0A8S9UL62_PHYIN|nr:hypothetical protein GN958_ATG09308 [Phytophthora infestans]